MNTQKLMVAGLLSMATLASCQNNANQENTQKDQVKTELAATPADSLDTLTTSIPVDSANKMINSYLTSISSQSNQLNSLIVDAGSLRNYLSNPNIKHVKLMFAHTLNYINSGHSGQNAAYTSGALTLIIAGYDANGNYVLDSKGGVEDNLGACPYNCPTSGTAASNTITTVTQ